MLAARHPLPKSDAIGFDAERHEYTVDGVVVPRSVTGVVDALFGAFKPVRTVNKYYDGWKRSGKSKYQKTIAAAASDADAKRAILKQWDAAGEAGRTLGTLLHANVEDALNGVAPDAEKRRKVEAECQQFERWLAEWAAPRGLAPYRTELKCTMRGLSGAAVVAGMADAVFVDALGQHHLVDRKKVAKPISSQEYAHGRTGKGLASEVSDTKFNNYSIQLAFYARMLRETVGIDVGERRYVVKLVKEGYEVIQMSSEKHIEKAVDRAVLRLIHAEPLLCADEVGSGDEDDDAGEWGA